VEFLQPMLLWGLPAVLLPLLIHLLNRLRYRQVDWAAMAFLLAAARRSTHSARVRHWLLLACRMLIVLFIIMALSRPLVRGRLGAWAGGAPDTVLMLLDRSASMEAQTQPGGPSLREQALAFFAQSGAGRRTAGSYVLIEHVERSPLALRSPSAVQELTLAGPTDTAADIPAMLRTAIDYIIDHNSGRTEILLVSDLQSSNWKPDDGAWETLREQLVSLAPDVRVLLLDLSVSEGVNKALSVQDAVVRKTDGREMLHLTMDIRASETVDHPFPLVMDIDGSRLQVDMEMENTAELRFSTGIELAGDGSSGWGRVEIPADVNLRDNVSYFVYGETSDGSVALAVEDARDGEIWRAAAGRNRVVEQVAIADTDRLSLDEVALLVMQGDNRDAAARAAAFAAAGGVVFLLPPGHAHSCEVMGIEWLAPERAAADFPFRVPIWDEHDGILSRTSGGMNLPLDQLTVARRQRFQFAEASGDGAGGRVLAHYADGVVFIEERQIGTGRLFVCSTLPETEWSSLEDGMVLVPMVQRLIRLGNVRLGSVLSGVCGEWRPMASDELWVPVNGEEHHHPSLHAGVYRSGGRLLAINRPAREDAPDLLQREQVDALFDGARLVVLEGPDAVAQYGRDGSEIWYWLVCLALVGLILEGILNREHGVASRKQEIGQARRAS